MPTGELRHVRMTVAYDGAPFRGFAVQPGLKTVAGTLIEALATVTQHRVELVCAGRTDAGVHGWGQVVSLDLPKEADLDRVQRSVNKLCAPSIVVRDIDDVSIGFNARYSAKARTYRYTVLNRQVNDPFLAATSWWVVDPLDLHALVMACDPFIGAHDFTSFCKKEKGRDISPPTLRRRVLDAHWEDEGAGILRLWVCAESFCHQMVRAIVGTIVDAGRFKLHVGDITAILRSRDRSLAGTLAPAHGLCLWEVAY